MLSYRHAYHAGNHADVLKHWILYECAQYMLSKPKPFWYIDTHAGAGLYELGSAQANKTGEYQDGIERLWTQQHLPAGLAGYLNLVRSYNRSHRLRTYPGSPLVVKPGLRAQDRGILHEIHPTEWQILNKNLGKDSAFRLENEDGFAGLRALLPPLPRRALVLIDPPYEVKSDYRQVVDAMEEALKRFATGVYCVWYPLIDNADAKKLPLKLEKLPCDKWLNVKLMVNETGANSGLFGSGMFIVNPPWPLFASVSETLPWLAKTLGSEGAGHYTLRSKGLD